MFFLHGDLEVEVYTEQSPRFVRFNQSRCIVITKQLSTLLPIQYSMRGLNTFEKSCCPRKFTLYICQIKWSTGKCTNKILEWTSDCIYSFKAWYI